MNAKRRCAGHNESIPNYGYSSFLKNCHLRRIQNWITDKVMSLEYKPWWSMRQSCLPNMVFLVTTCHAVIISLTMSCYIDISYNFVLINKFSLPFQPCLFVTNLAPTTMMTQTTTPTGIPTPANPLHQTFDWFS